MESSALLIHCRELSVQFEKHIAVAEFGLNLPAGRAVALIGPNGAGKSSVLKLCSGLIAESSGTIEVLGQRPKSAPRSWKGQLGVLPENLALFDALSIAEHLHLSAELYGIRASEAKPRQEELLQVLCLRGMEHRFAGKCSYGMRKKTALALALLHAPRLLLLDEPFEGLDPASCESVLALLQLAKSRGTGILFSSHMLSHVERLADEVLLLHEGRVSWRGSALSPDQLRAHYLKTIEPPPLPELRWL